MDPALPNRQRWPQRSLVVDGWTALGVGVLVGVATFLGQGVMPGEWNTLVNSGAIWLVPPFFMGAHVGSRRLAAFAGAAVLLATVAGYYAAAGLADAPMSTWIIAFWFGVAIVAGPLYGVAGRWSRNGTRSFRVIGVALFGGIFVAEALYLSVVLRYFGAGAVMLATGLVVTFLLAQSGDRLATLLVLPVPALAAGLVYGLLNWLIQLRTV